MIFISASDLTADFTVGFEPNSRDCRIRSLHLEQFWSSIRDELQISYWSSNTNLPPDEFACLWSIWCDLGCCSRTVVVIKATAKIRLSRRILSDFAEIFIWIRDFCKIFACRRFWRTKELSYFKGQRTWNLSPDPCQEMSCQGISPLLESLPGLSSTLLAGLDRCTDSCRSSSLNIFIAGQKWTIRTSFANTMVHQNKLVVSENRIV